MTDAEFRNSFKKVLALKKNSFSRNLLLSYENELRELVLSKWNPLNVNYATQYRLATQDKTLELAVFLYEYPFLDIHAIDEKEAPVPFSVLEEIYGENVFVLQRLEKKNSLMLLIEDIRQIESATQQTKYKRDAAVAQVFASTWNYSSREFKGDLNANSMSYLDFGFLKNAMTLRKTYGIQDLLEIGFQIFSAYRNKKNENYGLRSEFKDLLSSCRIVFNVEHPELSTVTLMGGNTLTLQGKTKIIEEKDFVDKISFAIKIFNACNVFNNVCSAVSYFHAKGNLDEHCF